MGEREIPDYRELLTEEEAQQLCFSLIGKHFKQISQIASCIVASIGIKFASEEILVLNSRNSMLFFGVLWKFLTEAEGP